MATLYELLTGLVSDGSYRAELPGVRGMPVRKPASVRMLEAGGDYIPGYGDVTAMIEAGQALSEGELLAAGLLGTGAAIGLVPGAGDAIARPVIAAGRRVGEAIPSEVIYAGRSVAQGDPRGILEAFATGRDARSLSARGIGDNGGPPMTMTPDERIASSTPASWRDEKYQLPQWHPISGVAMTVPPNAMDVRVRDLGTLEGNTRPLRIEDMQGRVLTPAYGDRTIAGVNILGFDEVDFADPVRSQGGRDFMRERGTGLWASEFKPMREKSEVINRLLEAGEDPALVYTAMGAQSGDFSTIMMDAVMNQFDPRKISDDAARKFDDRMKKIGVKSWPGTKSGKVGEALRNMPGTTRWAVWQEMDKASFRDAGFPDIGRTRVSITDPELLNVDPFSTGLNVGRPEGLLTNTMFERHPSYEYQIGGDYEGTLGNLPGQLIWRDFFEGRRASGAAPGGDQRSFMMQSPRIIQRVDQQMVDEVNEYLRRLEQVR